MTGSYVNHSINLGHMFLQKMMKLQKFSDSAGWSQIGLKNQTEFEKKKSDQVLKFKKSWSQKLGFKNLVTRKNKQLITPLRESATIFLSPGRYINSGPKSSMVSLQRMMHAELCILYVKF